MPPMMFFAINDPFHGYTSKPFFSLVVLGKCHFTKSNTIMKVAGMLNYCYQIRTKLSDSPLMSEVSPKNMAIRERKLGGGAPQNV